MGFTEVLTIIFIVLKLIGTISWEWWLVLLPEIVVMVFYSIVIVIYFKQYREIKRDLKQLEKDILDDWK